MLATMPSRPARSSSCWDGQAVDVPIRHRRPRPPGAREVLPGGGHRPQPTEAAESWPAANETLCKPRSPRKRAEAALRESEERFRLLVEGMQDYAILMLDPDGRVVTWNAGAERLKGYAPQEIVGQHFSRFYPPEDAAAGKPQRELAVAAERGSTSRRAGASQGRLALLGRGDDHRSYAARRANRGFAN